MKRLRWRPIVMFMLGILFVSASFVPVLLAGVWNSAENDLTGGFHLRRKEHPRSKVLGLTADLKTGCIGTNETKNPLHDGTEPAGDVDRAQDVSYTFWTNGTLYVIGALDAEWEFTNELGATYVEHWEYYTIRGEISVARHTVPWR